MFICPGCGDEVDESEDLIICDECFEEALSIREIRSQIAAQQAGSTDRGPSPVIDLDKLWKRADVAENFYRGARPGTRDRDSYEMAKIIKDLIEELRRIQREGLQALDNHDTIDL